MRRIAVIGSVIGLSTLVAVCYPGTSATAPSGEDGLPAPLAKLVFNEKGEAVLPKGYRSWDLRALACNVRAIHCYESCGFVVEGREREATLVDGFRHDDVIVGILAPEFRARRSAVEAQQSQA
jgi:hypothetical protein